MDGSKLTTCEQDTGTCWTPLAVRRLGMRTELNGLASPILSDHTNLAQGTVNTSRMAQRTDFHNFTHHASMRQAELDWNACSTASVCGLRYSGTTRVDVLQPSRDTLEQPIEPLPTSERVVTGAEFVVYAGYAGAEWDTDEYATSVLCVTQECPAGGVRTPCTACTSTSVAALISVVPSGKPGLCNLLRSLEHEEQDIGSIVALGESQANPLRKIPPLTRLTTRRGLPMCDSSLALKLALVTVNMSYTAHQALLSAASIFTGALRSAFGHTHRETTLLDEDLPTTQRRGSFASSSAEVITMQSWPFEYSCLAPAGVTRARSSSLCKMETWRAMTRSDRIPVPASGSASFHTARTKTSAGDMFASAPGVVLDLDSHAHHCPALALAKTTSEGVVAGAEPAIHADAHWVAGVFYLRVLLNGLVRTSGGGGARADSKNL
ncbi:hypothetical protein VTO73DRAFT_13815 [Trametes versicolor]